MQFATVCCFVALLTPEVHGYGKRVNQIPNGQVFGCANCHIDPNGGGPRTLFGQEIEANFLSAPGFAGDVVWGPELAALDSDGDEAPNGLELQDPGGSWMTGTTAPGNPDLVSNPGDETSVPAVAVETTTWSTIKSLFAGK